ncbi:hypothetical protein KFE96_06060 [Kordiimonas sp. SCSIO 12603]|uniref:hypothetical protein n=1 Tax=Kordiimonas sp. SCSIO 12603 TaxID=2829596 RepID=UPI00210671BC|nr:hypothetical protein [Kordiimonas sp. SCSIO 12603]UTW59866.1 hypothetical protein KFE96_06060 [Kordiimonas sp. SCSIO 12603]
MVFKRLLAAAVQHSEARALKKELALLLKTNTLESRLQALHTLEFNFPSTYRLPWIYWGRLSDIAKQSYNAVEETIFQLSGISDLELQILNTAKASRSPGSPGSPPEEMFTDIEASREVARTLSPHVRLEYLLLAFLARKHQLSGLLSQDMLADKQLFLRDIDEEKIRDLLFDILTFTAIRRHMPQFVQNPKAMMRRLAAIASYPFTQDILNKNRVAAVNFQATQCTMHGKFDEAVDHYKKASNMEGFNSSIFEQMHVVADIKDVIRDHNDTYHWYENKHQTSFTYRHKTTDEQAVLISCDTKYFHSYAELFLQVIGASNPSPLVHFHIVDSKPIDPHFEELMLRWEKEYDVRLNWTFEVNHILHDRPQKKAAIASCARYMLLPEYLKAYKSIFISDIDGWINMPLEEFHNFGDGSLKINSWIWRKNQGYWRLLWGNIAAGNFSIKSDGPGRLYATLVSSYIKRLFKANAYNEKNIFFADQTAMFLSLKYLEQQKAISFDFLIGGFSQSAHQSFHSRHDAKQKAMIEKLKEIKEQPN